MEQSSSSGQEIYLILRKPKRHCCIHNSPLPVHMLEQFYSVHSFPFCFFKPHFNIILLSERVTPKCSFFFRFPHKNSLCIYLFSHTLCQILTKTWKGSINISKIPEYQNSYAKSVLWYLSFRIRTYLYGKASRRIFATFRFDAILACFAL
jgi:hypothetical protein